MNKHVIITISREFGSNGREIGRKLAEYLDIGYYNKAIMKKISQDLGVSDDFFGEDSQNEKGFYNISHRKSDLVNMTELSINAQIYQRASDLIQKISEMESAVIIGRCADYILKENKNCIRIFFYCDPNQRIDHAIDAYNVPAKKAKKFVQAQDAKRAGFYEYYTNQVWKNPSNYDLMINTSQMSEDDIITMIASLFDHKSGVESFKGAFENQYIEHKSNEI